MTESNNSTPSAQPTLSNTAQSSQSKIHLLCKWGEDWHEWSVLSASADPMPLEQAAAQFNQDTYDKEHADWIARGKTGAFPLRLDDPSRQGFLPYFVRAVPAWPNQPLPPPTPIAGHIEALRLARQCAEWHIQDTDDCGTIARRLIYAIDAIAGRVDAGPSWETDT